MSKFFAAKRNDSGSYLLRRQLKRPPHGLPSRMVARAPPTRVRLAVQLLDVLADSATAGQAHRAAVGRGPRACFGGAQDHRNRARLARARAQRRGVVSPGCGTQASRAEAATHAEALSRRSELLTQSD